MNSARRRVRRETNKFVRRCVLDSAQFLDLVWKRSNRRVLLDAPEEPGTYIFRLANSKTIGRLRGESDILYVGCTTKGNRTVRTRLKDHFLARTTERNTAHYLRRVQREVGEIEISWGTLRTHREARDSERILLARYGDDHIEFPPLNRQESGKMYRQARELVESLPAWKSGMNFSDLLMRLQSV